MNLIYNNKTSDDYGLIVCYFETIDRIESGLTRTVEFGTSNNYRYIPSSSSVSYEGQINFKINFIKKDSSTFTMSEIRTYNNWLMGSSIPKELKCDYDDKQLLYNGIFTNVEYIITSGIIGLEYTFTNNSPFVYKKYYEEFNVNANNSITINCDTDLLEGYIYPKFTIEQNGIDEEEIKIVNKSDRSNSMSIIIKDSLPIVVDCLHQIISDGLNQVNFRDLGWTDSSDIYWLRLLPGSNTLLINKTCKIKMELLLPLKVGVLYEY